MKANTSIFVGILLVTACGAEGSAIDAPVADAPVADAHPPLDGASLVDAPGPAACSGLNLTYASQPTAVTAMEINRNNANLHALVINGNLNSDPDRLTIEAFYRFGVTTGTFTTWDSSSTWLFNVIDGSSTRQLYTKSGTFVVTSVTGTFAATTTNMVLVDNRAAPTCFVNLPDMTINVPITQP